MKKALAIGLAVVMAVSMSAPVFASDDSESGAGIAKEDLKIGAIYIGDENEGYTAAHILRHVRLRMMNFLRIHASKSTVSSRVVWM